MYIKCIYIYVICIYIYIYTIMFRQNWCIFLLCLRCNHAIMKQTKMQGVFRMVPAVMFEDV